MYKLANPAGGSTWVHPSRLDEYLRRGYKLTTPPELPPKPKSQPKKKTTKPKG